jgi:LysM repeat protein
MKGQKLAIKTTTQKKVTKIVPITSASSTSKQVIPSNINTPINVREIENNIPTISSSESLPNTGVKYALHTVLPGETIYTIAKQYNDASVDGIKQFNNMNSTEVKVGTTLRIPIQ